MKKRFLTIALGLATTVAFGQIEAGTKILGGTFSFYDMENKNETSFGGQTTTTENPSSTMTFAPSFGYMFKENMGAGIGIEVANTSDGPDTNKFETSQFALNLFGRYYMPVAGDNLYFHTDLVIGFLLSGTAKTTSGSNSSENSLGGFQVGLRPGWDYFIGEKWALSLNWGWLGYTSVTSTFDEAGFKDEDTYTEFGIDFDFSTFALGANWYF